MPTVRRAQASDLAGLLDLFRASEVSPPTEPGAHAERIWAEILERKGVTVFVSDAEAGLAATCMLITAPNLLRSGQGHAFLENVVTRPGLRGRGHGRAVVQAALDAAWSEGCFHVLLQSGRKDERVHRFYASCGFRPGVRTAYAATRPG
jgi:GNAT superfamily N-acetyltransferase